MPRYQIWVEYDGRAFCGWQAQKDGASVQAALTAALYAYCGERTIFYGAGRTDSGVHALAQSAHFDLVEGKPCDEICLAMNFHLRQQNQKACILSAQKTDQEFHARFSAQKRHYIYVILNRQAPPILLADRVWHIAAPLDEERMHEAAQCLIGQHDFTTFRAAACQATSPIKTLEQLSVRRWGAHVIYIEAIARSFLHHQIRSFVGALAKVGAGKMSSEDVADILRAADRSLCPSLAPPQGLYLAQIDYPNVIQQNHANIKRLFDETFAAHP